MKSILAIATMVLMTQCAGYGQSTRPADHRGSEREAVLKHEREWTEAFKNRDKSALTRLLAENFVFTDDEGRLSNKAQYIDAVLNAIRVESYSIDDLDVRLARDTAVVTGRWSGKVTVGGADASGSFRFTDTFVRSQGRWQILASQDTRIPEQK